MNEISARARRWTTAALAALTLALPSHATPHATMGAQQSSREQATLVEEQALLLRQLQRLQRQMEVLLGRFEAEGRTHAAQLLREGLEHLSARAAETEARRLDELMDRSREDMDSGQPVRALETQEIVVLGLERLLSILLDRRGVEELDRAIDELRALREGLAKLADQEADLREKTQDLAERTTSEEQRALTEKVREAIERQSALLEQNERGARESGSAELERMEAELAELARREGIDREVLEAWSPNADARLAAARPRLEAARRDAGRAERLESAARELRSAAAGTRREDPAAQQAAREALEQAAERARRHERASNDPVAARAAGALSRGAQSLREVQDSPAGDPAREGAAKALEDEAAALEAEAAQAQQAAREAARGARAELEELAHSDSSAGELARRVAEKIAGAQSPPRAGSESEKTPAEGGEPSAAEAARALEQAARALEEGLGLQETLPRALAASQGAQAEASESLERRLDALPATESAADAPADSELEKAKEALHEAARAMREAASAAGERSAEDAASAAHEAEEALARARAALGSERAQRASSASEAALDEAQRALAAETERMAQQSSSSGLPQRAASEAREALEQAQASMEQAASELSQGQSASASRSQREALSALRQAAQSASAAGAPETPEEQAEAQRLAEEQERIRQELLALAERNQEREGSRESPGMQRASQSSERAEESLSQGDLEQAEGEEERTEQALRQAEQDLAEEEEQYQRLRQEELLFRIAEEVKTLIEAHRVQMLATRDVDQVREPGERPSRGLRLRLRGVAREEEALGKRAAELGTAIRAESSLVFAEIFAQVSSDLARIARDMGEVGDWQSGERVQALQQDVEQSLVWLAEALEEEKERRRSEEQQQQQQQQQQGENRLVPDVAELKLLRRLEVEVLDAIDQLMIVHPEIARTADAIDGGEPVEIDPFVLEDIGRLASRHERTSALFEQFRRRLGLPDPGGALPTIEKDPEHPPEGAPKENEHEEENR